MVLGWFRAAEGVVVVRVYASDSVYMCVCGQVGVWEQRRGQLLREKYDLGGIAGVGVDV